jgi:hypothetical protein
MHHLLPLRRDHGVMVCSFLLGVHLLRVLSLCENFVHKCAPDVPIDCIILFLLLVSAGAFSVVVGV